ncbi:hypothetical protein [Bordetella trematum]|uniref:hypothetical protein n=1 Tax=Bordetella trematum TaxID=123899 RepID=UPI000D81C815|nr:hypothetical protein [Bordetella trematum]SPU49865.1 Uncharacterised protein [Bordetella trematum]VDH07610.1 Uncharacterised protein [Bordetella trematum]
MNLHSFKVTILRTETTVKSIDVWIEAESPEDARTLAKYRDIPSYEWSMALPDRSEKTEVIAAELLPQASEA